VQSLESWSPPNTSVRPYNRRSRADTPAGSRGRAHVRFSGRSGGLTPHCMRTTSPLELVWRVRFDPPRRVPGATRQNVGYKKNFCLLRSQIIRVQNNDFGKITTLVKLNNRSVGNNRCFCNSKTAASVRKNTIMKNLPAGQWRFFLFFNLFHHHSAVYSANDFQQRTYCSILPRLLRGYLFLMPSCAGLLEPIKSRLRPSKSTFNVKNFIRSLSMSISINFSAIRSCNVSRSPKSPKNL